MVIKNNLLIPLYLVIYFSIIFATVNSYYRNDGTFLLNLGYVIAYSASLLIILQKFPFKIFTVTFWVYAVCNLSYMFYEIFSCSIRVGGLLGNPNPLSALFNLAIIWLFQIRTVLGYLVSAIFIAGLLFTGSRYGFIACVSLTVCYVVYLIALHDYRNIPFVFFAWLTGIAIFSIVGAITVFICSEPTAHLIAVERIGSVITANADANVSEAVTRVSLPHNPVIIPYGEITSEQSIFMHNIPLRFSATFGILSAIAWSILILRSLLTTHLFSLSWWLLFAIFLTSGLDYYWIQPFTLMPFMWFLIGYRNYDLKVPHKNY